MKSRMGRNPFEKPAHAKFVKAQVRDPRGATSTKKNDTLFTRVATWALIDVPAEAFVLGIRAVALAKSAGICASVASARRKQT